MTGFSLILWNFKGYVLKSIVNNKEEKRPKGVFQFYALPGRGTRALRRRPLVNLRLVQNVRKLKSLL